MGRPPRACWATIGCPPQSAPRGALTSLAASQGVSPSGSASVSTAGGTLSSRRPRTTASSSPSSSSACSRAAASAPAPKWWVPSPPPPPRCAAAPRCVAVPHILAPPPAACLCLPARPLPQRGSSALLVDYGSGSARMVAAAAIVAGVASLGIEGDLHRHQLAVVRMGALVWGHLGELVAGMLASAALRFGDASELLVEAAPTHVYAFDSVFSDVGVAAFAQALLAAAPAVFVSFRPPGDLAKLGVCGGGDAPYVCVLKGSAATAGVQKFTYHVYVQRRYYVPRPAAAAVPPPMPPPSPPKPPR